jgi:lysyl-tRNA synthetase class I
MPSVPHCPNCHKIMQVADIVWGDKKEIIAVRYVCGCKDPPVQMNWHQGQSGKKDK